MEGSEIHITFADMNGKIQMKDSSQSALTRRLFTTKLHSHLRFEGKVFCPRLRLLLVYHKYVSNQSPTRGNGQVGWMGQTNKHAQVKPNVNVDLF